MEPLVMVTWDIVNGSTMALNWRGEANVPIQQLDGGIYRVLSQPGGRDVTHSRLTSAGHSYSAVHPIHTQHTLNIHSNHTHHTS